jgi:hypothetical protein
MAFDKIEKHFSFEVRINGNNLGEVNDARFGRISSNNGEMALFNDYPEMKKQIKVLEDFVINVYTEAENTKVTPLPEQDGKIVLKNGIPYHRASNDLLTLKNISVGGILASEWFGHLESEGEGRFCAFLSRTIDETIATGFRTKNIQNRFASPSNCVIYFDESNPIMQMLMKLDYFEYEHLKSTDPDKIKEIYPKEVIDIMDTLIEPISKAGRKMHDNPKLPFYDWLAIPGAIPPQLVNGICVHTSKKEIMSSLDKISEMFPNATIFDETQKVLVSAKTKTADSSTFGE